MRDEDLREQYHKILRDVEADGEHQEYYQCAHNPTELLAALKRDGAPQNVPQVVYDAITQLHPETFRRHRPHSVRTTKLDQLTCPVCHKGKRDLDKLKAQHTGCADLNECMQGACDLAAFVTAQVADMAAQVKKEFATLASDGDTHADRKAKREQAKDTVVELRAQAAQKSKMEARLLLQQHKMSEDEFKQRLNEILIRGDPNKQAESRAKVAAEVTAYVAHKALNRTQRNKFKWWFRNLRASQILIIIDFAARFQESYWGGTIMSDVLDGDTIPDHVMVVYRRVGDKVEALYVHVLTESYVREAGGVYVYQTLRMLVDLGIIPSDTRDLIVFSDGCSRHYK